MNSVHDLWQSGLIRASANRELAYELKPGTDSHFKLARFSTNGDGLRYGPVAPAKPEGGRRIAIVGSSFSMPAGTTLEDAWHQQVARDLDAREPGRGHEAVNFAVGGYNGRQLLAVLNDRVFLYAPDLVVFELTTHSPYIDYPDDFFRRPYVVEPQTRPFFRSFVVERIRSRFEPAGADPIPYPPGRLAEAERLIERAARIAAERGVPICFVILNMDTDYRVNAEALARAAARHSSCVVDTTAAFTGRALSDLVIYRTDQHPNAKAHRIFADAISPPIARALGIGSP